MAKRGRRSADDIAFKLETKEKAQAISNYLNRLEEIYSNYSSREANEDKVAEMSMLTGKAMVTFSDLCQMLEIFDEE